MALNDTIQIWSGGDCAGPPGYGYGGWAWLAVQGGEARGFVGGERHTTLGRMVLRGAVEALKAAADRPAAPVQLDPGDPAVARLAHDWRARQAAGWRTVEDEPMEDADLWAELAKLAGARAGLVHFGRLKPDGRTFIAAWTDFARDRCRDKGVFTSAIPKPNLTTFLAKRV